MIRHKTFLCFFFSGTVSCTSLSVRTASKRTLLVLQDIALQNRLQPAQSHNHHLAARHFPTQRRPQNQLSEAPSTRQGPVRASNSTQHRLPTCHPRLPSNHACSTSPENRTSLLRPLPKRSTEVPLAMPNSSNRPALQQEKTTHRWTEQPCISCHRAKPSQTSLKVPQLGQVAPP